MTWHKGVALGEKCPCSMGHRIVLVTEVGWNSAELDNVKEVAITFSTRATVYAARSITETCES